ncbi:hypothetical protein AeMF1_020026 [Aphanomyces euteiches]|nr:hypothetical protein AeMF1_020026 [Aphanomyces euteiches]
MIAVDSFQPVERYGRRRDHEQENCMFNLYVADPDNLSHYSSRSQWRLCMDSGYALTKLTKQVCTDNFSQAYQFGTSIDAGFDRTAFKLYFHHAINECLVKKKPVVIYMRNSLTYHRIEIVPKQLQCYGGNESDCYNYLETSLSDNTYWHAKYAFFPFIDAVVVCQAFKHARARPEKIIAYIQVTTQDEKKFKPNHLTKLNIAVHFNP